MNLTRIDSSEMPESQDFENSRMPVTLPLIHTVHSNSPCSTPVTGNTAICPCCCSKAVAGHLVCRRMFLWGGQKFFKLIPGVELTEVGFANGKIQNPTYEQVYTDTTGYAECVHVRYNSEIISLKELTRLYFKIIDPLSLDRQGEDKGTGYRTGV